MMDDKQLLGVYAQERSKAAFGKLMARHIDFVYSAAPPVVNGDSLALLPNRERFSPPAEPGMRFLKDSLSLFATSGHL